MATQPTTANVSLRAATSPVARGVLPATVGSQASTLSIAVPVALARLSGSDLQISPIAPQFLQTASDTLGNFGEGTDGFDALFAIPSNSLNDDVDAIGQLDQHILDADFTEGEIDSVTLGPVGNDLISFTQSGDDILTAFGVAVTPTGNPPPTNNPPPPQPHPRPNPGVGGGGGGGGGGNPPPQGTGGGPGLKCTVVSNPITGEFVGVHCEPSGVPGQGSHGPLQE